MANNRILYWGGGLGKLDLVIEKAYVPCFRDTESAGTIILHDVLNDDVQRNDLKAKYEDVKRQIKRAPKTSKVVVIPGSNDDEQLLDEVLGKWVVKGKTDVGSLKIFGVNFYHGQTEPRSGQNDISLEESLLQQSEDADVFVTSAPVSGCYSKDIAANKNYRRDKLKMLQDGYVKGKGSWSDHGTRNGQKCKLLITPAAINDFDDVWSAVESSVVLKAGGFYPKPGNHGADHQLSIDYAYLIDYDDEKGVQKFRAMRPNGSAVTVFERNYIFERAPNVEGVTRFELKGAHSDTGIKHKTTKVERINPDTDISDMVEKARVIYRRKVNVQEEVVVELDPQKKAVFAPMMYFAQEISKGKRKGQIKLPKRKKAQQAIFDINDAFWEEIAHDSDLERYHVIVRAFEKHGKQLKGTVRAHAKRMIKSYLPAIKNNDELFTHIRGLEARLDEFYQNAVGAEKKDKEAREAKKKANKDKPKKKTAFQQVKEDFERLKSSNDVLHVKCTAAENEKKLLEIDLKQLRSFGNGHNQMYDLSDKLNKQGLAVLDQKPLDAAGLFIQAINLMEKDPIRHEKRVADFTYNLGLAHVEAADQNLMVDRDTAREQYELALENLGQIKGDADAESLAEDVRKNLEALSRPEPVTVSAPVPADVNEIKIKQPFDFTPPKD